MEMRAAINERRDTHPAQQRLCQSFAKNDFRESLIVPFPSVQPPVPLVPKTHLAPETTLPRLQ